MKIAITAALAMEFHTFKKCMGRVQMLPLGAWQHYIWQHNGNQVILLETGIGPDQSAGALKALLQIHQVDCIINFGSAGMIDQNLEVGDAFLADEVTNTQNGKIIKTNDQINVAIGQFLGEFDKPYRHGRLITSPEPVVQRSQRQRLEKKFGCGAVDMEAFAQAKIAAARHIPFAALKMISDHANALTRIVYWKNIRQVDRKLGKILYGFIDYLKAA